MSIARPVSILMFIKKSGIFHVSKQGMLALIKGHLISEQIWENLFWDYLSNQSLVDKFMKICHKQIPNSDPDPDRPQTFPKIVLFLS